MKALWFLKSICYLLKQNVSARIFVVFLSLALLPNLGLAAVAELHETRISTLIDTTRLVLVFDQPINHQFTKLKNPNRVVITIPNAKLKARVDDLPLWQSPIQKIQVSPSAKNEIRLIFEIKNDVDYKIFILKNTKDKNSRLVLDLTPKKIVNVEPLQQPTATKNTNLIKKEIVAIEKKAEVMAEVLEKVSEQQKRKIVVVIDPGHGGKDPGARGGNGVYEKDVVLAISRALQRELNHMPGIKAVLTRSGDYYIPLRERLRIARRYKGDFFIAIHADAFPHPFAKGASVFALSERGATSEAARWLAEKENYSELGGVALSHKSRLVRSVLLDLSQTATINQSLQGGQAVLTSLSQITDLHRGRIEQAPFMVLKSPDIPSLLVETGFITNPYEAQRLGDPRYQVRLAQAITLGMKGYFWRYPPPDSLIAYLKQKNKIV